MKISRRLIGVCAAVTLAAAVPLSMVLTSGAATEALISQGKPATASSLENSSLSAAKAVDGKSNTRWASAEGSDPQWVQVDLGATRTISHVVLNWEVAYGKAYQVQTSTDATTWTDIFTTTSGNGGTDDLKNLSGSGRYVRVLGTKRGTPYGYSLWELKIYSGGAGGDPTPVPSPSTATPTDPAATTPTSNPTGGHVDLSDPHKKEIALELVSSAENSTLNWRGQYGYIKDIGDGRGYTAGIMGFCSGTGDMLDLVEAYTNRSQNNVLAKYLPALRDLARKGSASHAGLDPNYPADWRTAAKDPVFQQTQDSERDRVYFNPAVGQAKTDNLHALGQFIYFDAAVVHGPDGMESIRRRAMAKAKTPAQGGNEVTYLNAFLDERVVEMKKEKAHEDTSRIDTAQRVFLKAGNLDLNPPLSWKVYGDSYSIAS